MKIQLISLWMLLVGLSISVQSAPISDEFKGSLLKVEGGKLKKCADAEVLGKKVYALYFSAHWCFPCRGFTPTLVEFYNKIKPKHPEFELVFISQDHSAAEMEGYMLGSSMPWPAISFDFIEKKKKILAYKGDGMPCLVVVDSNGKVLSDTFVNGNFRRPMAVLPELEKILKAK